MLCKFGLAFPSMDAIDWALLFGLSCDVSQMF